MGLFGFGKKKDNPVKAATAIKPIEQKKKSPLYIVDNSIPESEKQYYQDDSYYTLVSHPGTMFEQKVITFDERKKTAIPSENGLYVPEILMLYFCKQYPNPKNGYPGYWWFNYGIRNVGAVLTSLVDRGFITLGSAGKYQLTEKGKAELAANEYVPYMHTKIKRTDFTAWDMNLILGHGDKSGFMAIIEAKEKENQAQQEKHNAELKASLQKTNPSLAADLDAQDKQLAEIQAAESKYTADKDIDSLIAFWENLWNNGGLTFDGMKWAFRLADLYIKVKRYDDALSFLDRLKKPIYQDKAASYRQKIEEKKAKQKK